MSNNNVPSANRAEFRDRRTRSKSNLSQPGVVAKKEPTYKSLKLIGGQTITLPTRERFNEEVESVIQENKEKTNQTLNHKNIN